MIKIAIDTLGGDKSPDANIEGALSALDRHNDLSLIFLGDENAIEEKFASLKIPLENCMRVKLIHAPDTITGEDKPTDAIRLKKDSSMVRAMKLIREDESVNALVSTGATVLHAATAVGGRAGSLCPPLSPTA